MIPKNKRKLGKIYCNTDEKGNPLTYSILKKLETSGHIIEIEKNNRRSLKCFLKKYDNI